MKFENRVVVLDATGGRALWETGDTHPSECFSYSLQADATIIIGTETSIDNDQGLSLASDQIWSQGNQEVRGSDVGIDLTKIFVKGAANVTLLMEIADN